MHTSSTIVMLLRVLVRIFMTKSFGSDDYCMLVAWLMQLATFICFLGERPYAMGRHIECITPHGYRMHGKWQYYHSLWVMFGVVLVKVSIALFLMRLVPPGKRWKSFLWASIGMHAGPWSHPLLTMYSLPHLLYDHLRWYIDLAMCACQRRLGCGGARRPEHHVLE